MKRKYKVGDTIYVEDTVVSIDEYDSIASYRGKYNGWFANKAIIDELPTAEPVKPVLPKNVADEMEAYKEYGDDFNEYIYNVMAVPDTHYLIKTHDTFIRSNITVETLLNAWNNGYTIEQVPRYMVYVPGTNKHYLYVKRGSWAKVDNKKATPITLQSINNYLTAGGNRDLYWFTDEEISKFGLQDCEKEEVTDDDE